MKERMRRNLVVRQKDLNYDAAFLTSCLFNFQYFIIIIVHTYVVVLFLNRHSLMKKKKEEKKIIFFRREQEAASNKYASRLQLSFHFKPVSRGRKKP